MLIDTEIGKMHVSLFDILHFGIVLMGSKPGESFVEHVNSQRIVTGDKNINSQIILEPIDEMRVMNVLRDKCIFFIFDFGLFVDHLDTPATGLIGRFHNPESSFLGVLSDHFETVEICRKEIGDRYKVVIFGKTATLLV
jgi:hypothetical protein